MTAIGRADDGPTERHNSIGVPTIENEMIAGRKQPFETVAKSNHFPTKLVGGEDHTAQHGIEPGTITAAR
jgi:hypothetical protein